jgi:hypothetical protein
VADENYENEPLGPAYSAYADELALLKQRPPVRRYPMHYGLDYTKKSEAPRIALPPPQKSDNGDELMQWMTIFGG